MRLADFDYALPRERIAAFPCARREDARLCVVDRAAGTVEHRIFADLGSFLRPKDALVLNDTKVLSCRLNGRRKSGGRVEVLLIEKRDASRFRALIRPGRLKTGEEILFNNGSLRATFTGRQELTFSGADAASVYAHGQMPLPPYIRRPPQPSDAADYQTVYACHDGSVAAPTAGLHFSRPMLQDLQEKGVGLAYLTLHVGYGTFRPVSADDVRAHRMEAEFYDLPEAAVRTIAATRASGGRVCAVGTTSCRTLESYALSHVSSGKTDLFIYPGFSFRGTDMLLTNFHLPRTTLLMLVCAFGGMDLVRRAYAEAIERGYRFYSYGDAMLVL